VGRAEQLLEPLAGQAGRLGQEREDAAAVVVHDDAHQVDAPAGGPQQAVAVVQEGDIADQQRGGRPGPRGDPDRSRHDAVDAVGPPVGDDPDAGAGRGVALDVAHGHRRRHDEGRPGGQRRHELPGHPGLAQPSLLGPEEAVERGGRGGGGGLPGGEPAVRRRGQRQFGAERRSPRRHRVRRVGPGHGRGGGRRVGPRPPGDHDLLGARAGEPLGDDPGRRRRPQAHDHLRLQLAGHPGRPQHGVEVRHQGRRRPPRRRPGIGQHGPPQHPRHPMERRPTPLVSRTDRPRRPAAVARLVERTAGTTHAGFAAVARSRPSDAT
jgi:hypothetical protein